MSDIKYITGDLFSTNCKVILHGCNDRGVMGSGVAKVIREKYPEAYNQYKAVYDAVGLKGGSFVPAKSNGKIILNAISQSGYGRDKKRYINYEWIYNIFESVNNWVDINGYYEIAMPQIGAGLGGGSWPIISAIIEDTATNYQPYVYILE